MTIDKNNMLNSIMESLDRIQYVKLDDIPNIDLYMDQVTTFMERKLKKTTRNQQDDKILTKTMINNYTKNDLLPPPERKKYTKDHILLLIFIYYYKGILSIHDIQTLLGPLTESFFGTADDFNLSSIYQEVFALEKEQIEVLKEDIVKKFEISQETFTDAPKDDQEFLRLFSFICMLSFDVYIKRLLIEKMIDSMNGTEGEKKTNDKTARDAKK